MPYKWMMLAAFCMAAVPLSLFLQGDALEAAIIGIPSFLIAAVIFGCIHILRAE
jgi:hypothetical protein